MRPEILYSLCASTKTLPGVGNKLAQFLEKLCGNTVLSILMHLPNGVQKRKHVEHLSQARIGDLITAKVQVIEHVAQTKGRGKKPYQVVCQLGQHPIDLVFFNPNTHYLQQQLMPGSEVVISGKVEMFQQRLKITHPDHFGAPYTLKDWVGTEPLYPLTAGISQKQIRKFIQYAIETCPQLPEWLTEHTLEVKKWNDWLTSLKQLHQPQDDQDIEPTNPYRERLAYDELLSNQLALLLMRHHQKKQNGRQTPESVTLKQQLLDLLPYSLTEDQQKAIKEISQDMQSDEKMVRLLQGDVGAGKTIVAMFTMLNALESGAQAALMAPTEILARQHAVTIAPWAEHLGISFDILTGKDKKSKREQVYERLKNGEIQMIIGTHSLIQPEVEFKDLACVIIDEQHRFGVEQRFKLSEKGNKADILSMTATPIPRTLMMAAYGDLKSSYLHQKPAGRKEVVTKTISLERLDEIVNGLKRALERQDKVYWVCPLVEESETLDLAAAEERFASLEKIFPGKVGLVHGKMKSAEKDAVMQEFISGEIKILIATTVIEVGVNVEDATIMIIEHAERFGLSQLHQLRGRIGRGAADATCLLLYGPELSATAQSRLKAIKESTDGFKIAEEDFRLRGGGDVLGLKQSGMPSFRFADLYVHHKLLKEAHKEALYILNQDPYLESERGKALKILLYLFARDEMVKYLKAV